MQEIGICSDLFSLVWHDCQKYGAPSENQTYNNLFA